MCMCVYERMRACVCACMCVHVPVLSCEGSRKVLTSVLSLWEVPGICDVQNTVKQQWKPKNDTTQLLPP